MRIGVGLTVALFLLSGPALAQTPEQQAAVERAERVGRDLYEHDRAAWLATDAMREDLNRRDQRRVRGWITQREGDAVIVTFVADGEPLASIYRAVFRGSALTEKGAASAPLDDEQVRLYRARETASRPPLPTCGGAYNSVTLTREQDVITDVYLMPATTNERLVRVGGFQRVGVNLATGEIVESEAFSRSCLELPNEPPRRNEEPAGLFFTHLTSAVPTETHVFLNLSHGVPFFVIAGGGVWMINNGEVTLERGGAN